MDTGTASAACTSRVFASDRNLIRSKPSAEFAPFRLTCYRSGGNVANGVFRCSPENKES
jgi:hypothetical protein